MCARVWYHTLSSAEEAELICPTSTDLIDREQRRRKRRTRNPEEAGCWVSAPGFRAWELLVTDELVPLSVAFDTLMSSSLPSTAPPADVAPMAEEPTEDKQMRR